ncbi:hypothetical protein NA56DRAFT_647924 [Hyaloscypha hepaticicola]|uniref:Prion-inhibition and propagation HeLo domain-containing protein n=1 Tax=Hyaloscypha hepaticicola TaxID=2082293 RepID=A0A2J6PWU4_9HELO|nr:hypothetical protein NA56DRAFT_647924 [Hyaloscypha hepaticicola]
MVLPIDPIGLTTLSFVVAAKSWNTFKTALHFSDDATDLILRLDIEQARFHLWSHNAGHEKAGDSFDQCLLPVVDLVDQILKKLTALFEDADQLRTRYGLVDSGAAVDESKKLQRFLYNLNKALHATGIKTFPPEDDENVPPSLIRRTSMLKMARWGIRDKVHFKELVEVVETHVLKLNQLLNESQQKKLAEDRARLNAVIVGSIEDAATLQVVRSAALTGIQDSAINNLCGRLAFSDRISGVGISLPTFQLSLPLTDFPCLAGDRGNSTVRMLTQRASVDSVSDMLILLEKKTYPISSSQEEFSLLSNRIERIVLLLHVQRRDLRTLKCIGYIHDSPRNCWWIAFEYPMMIPAAVSSEAPVSLLDLFAHKTANRPPLESRIFLAGNLASSVSSLFNSGWLHKSIRSENILFPQLAPLNSDASLGVLASPFLTGFEYSRQHMERSLGKPWHKDINRAIYRHPFYQGQSPGPYRIQYDMYSFGLILVEIARWMPLSSFLDNRAASNPNPNTPQLSTNMQSFTESDARELQKRILYFVDREMAFRVGTRYRDAVRWCLTHADEKMESGLQEGLDNGVLATAEVDWRSALEFYNNVVVPLERQMSDHGEETF